MSPDEPPRPSRITGRRYQDREDLTEKVIFTIDPPDARDFDDAISIDFDKDAREDTWSAHRGRVLVCPAGGSDGSRGNGSWKQHIPSSSRSADASGDTSRGLLLQEGVNRFCKSAFITFDHRGVVIGQRLPPPSLLSQAIDLSRAQAIIDGDLQEGAGTCPTNCQPEVIESIHEANRLAKRFDRDVCVMG